LKDGTPKPFDTDTFKTVNGLKSFEEEGTEEDKLFWYGKINERTHEV